MIDFKAERYAVINMDREEEAEDFVKQLNTYISANKDSLEDSFLEEMSVEAVGLSVVIGPTILHITYATVALSFLIDNNYD